MNLPNPMARADGTSVAVDPVVVVGGTDSSDNTLPANFESKGSVTVYTPNAETATSKVETKTIAPYTYTRTTTFTPSVSGLVTKTVGDWVRS